MKWQRRSAHSIQSGEFVICRTRHSGIEPEPVELYTLWRGSEDMGSYWTAQAAKRKAEEAV